MVKVSVDLSKRDFAWIGLLVIFVGVGFVVAYGGVNPSVHGHSVGEIEIDNAFCNKITGRDCGEIEENEGLIVIDGGHIGEKTERNLGSDGILISLNGQYKSDDAASAGGYIYKQDGVWKAALFLATGGHGEFALTMDYGCTDTSGLVICAKKDSDNNIWVKTTRAVQVSYVVMK